jgi:hypothetical protein
MKITNLGKMPEQLLTSSERLLLDITEPLDPLISLRLTGLIKQLVHIAYLMGREDGRQISPDDLSTN